MSSTTAAIPKSVYTAVGKILDVGTTDSDATAHRNFWSIHPTDEGLYIVDLVESGFSIADSVGIKIRNLFKIRGTLLEIKDESVRVVSHSLGHSPTIIWDPRSGEHLSEMFSSKTRFFPRFDGMVVRVHWYEGNVLYSSHRRAQLQQSSKWGDSTPFLLMFKELGGPSPDELFGDVRSRSLSHTFLMVHPSLSNGSKGNHRFILHIGSLDENGNEHFVTSFGGLGIRIPGISRLPWPIVEEVPPGLYTAPALPCMTDKDRAEAKAYETEVALRKEKAWKYADKPALQPRKEKYFADDFLRKGFTGAAESLVVMDPELNYRTVTLAPMQYLWRSNVNGSLNNILFRLCEIHKLASTWSSASEDVEGISFDVVGANLFNKDGDSLIYRPPHSSDVTFGMLFPAFIASRHGIPKDEAEIIDKDLGEDSGMYTWSVQQSAFDPKGDSRSANDAITQQQFLFAVSVYLSCSPIDKRRAIQEGLSRYLEMKDDLVEFLLNNRKELTSSRDFETMSIFSNYKDFGGRREIKDVWGAKRFVEIANVSNDAAVKGVKKLKGATAAKRSAELYESQVRMFIAANEGDSSYSMYRLITKTLIDM